MEPQGGGFRYVGDVCKVDESLGLVFGYAIVCEKDGSPYHDKQGDHIPEADMLEKSLDFMLHSRAADEMHDCAETGTVPFAFPLTGEIAKQLGISSNRTGLLIGMKPAPEVFAKFADGTYTQFSIGGERFDLVEEDAA